MDKKGLKGLYLRYLFDLYQNGVITSDKNDELADKFDEIDMTDNNKVNSFETYIRDCIKNDKYNEKELKTLLDKCKKVNTNTNTNSSINNVMDLIKEISKLNPTVKFNLSNNNTIQPTLESVEDVNNLILPQGFTYNDKNGINNKHNTSTGNYITLDYKQVKPVKKQTNNTNTIGGNIMTIKELREEIERLNPTVKFRFYGEDIVSDCVLTSKENPSKLVLPQGFTYDKKIGIVNADNTLYMPYHQITAPSQRRHNKLVKAFRNLLNKTNSAKMPGAVPVRTTRKHRGLRALWDKLTGKKARKLNIAPTQPVNKGKELAEFMRANGLLNNKEVKDYIALINQSQDKNAKFTELYNYIKNNPDEAKDLNNMLNKLAQITGVPRKQNDAPKAQQINNKNVIEGKYKLIQMYSKMKEYVDAELAAQKPATKADKEQVIENALNTLGASLVAGKSAKEAMVIKQQINNYKNNRIKINYELNKIEDEYKKFKLVERSNNLTKKVNSYEKQLPNLDKKLNDALNKYNEALNNDAIKRHEPKKSDYYKKVKDATTNKMVPAVDSLGNKIFNEKAYKKAYDRYIQKYLSVEKDAYDKALNEYNALAQKIDNAKKVNNTASKIDVSNIEKNIEQHMDLIIALAYRSKDFKDMKQNAQVRNAARTI